MDKDPASAPDLAEIKRRQQATWAAGDFSMVAARIYYAAEQLAEAADLQAGWRVLDVATGSGNAALAAARRNAEVTGLDYVPSLLARARERAAAERLEIDFVEGDAEQLPFADGAYDAVLSIFGCMFAPDHRRTAQEIARVCRPGGRIALACWTPTGFVGEMFRAIAAFAPPAPGLTPPSRWGDADYQRSLFGDAVRDTRAAVRQSIIRVRSPQHYLDFFRRYFGPTIRAYESVPAERRDDLSGEILELVRRFDRNHGAGPVAIAADYLETLMTRA